MINVSKTDVWSAPIDDRPGGVVGMIEDLVLKGNLDLEFLLAQRLSDQAGRGTIFLLPLSGERQLAMAHQIGLVRNDSIFCLKVTGDDEPGISYRMLKALADRKLNLRAVSAAAVAGRFVMYVALDTPADADLAAKLLMAPL